MRRHVVESRPGRCVAACLAILLGAWPSGARAQETPDYLFAPPIVSVSARIGVFMPRARSDLHAFLTEHHTLARRDFDASAFAGEVGFRVADRADLVLGLAYAGVRRGTEFRDFEDSDGLPIRQELRQSQLPLTVGARLYAIPPGRRVGRLAWVPSAVALHAGAGVGMARNSLRLVGEFVESEPVDVDTWQIFYDDYRSDGWSPLAYAGAGFEVRINRHASAVADVRREWSSQRLGDDFVGFEPMDLTGSRATLGVQWRF
jgi:hypothetical protein